MGLRTRTIAILASVSVGVIALTHVILSEYLIKQVKDFEVNLVMQDLARVTQAIGAVGNNARDRVVDWGHWDETESFILGKNPTYVEANLTPGALEAFETRHYLFLNERLDVLHSGEVLADIDEIRPLQQSTVQEIVASPRVAQFLKSPSDEALTGILLVGGEPVVVAISTITDNHRTRKPAGYLIFTRAFSKRLQQQIAQQTQLPLAFQVRAGLGPNGAPDKGLITLSESSDRLVAKTIIPDMNRVPVMWVDFERPRELLAQSEGARRSLLISVAAFLLASTILVLWLLDRTILNPLQRLAKNVDLIATTNDLSQKVAVIGAGEIEKLASRFNQLLESLDLSHHRMFEAKRLAQEANASKSRFISVISHELRTPLQSLSGMLHILKRKESSDTKLGFIRMASDAAKDLAGTIDEILDFAKIEDGAMPLESRPLSLRETVRKCLIAADLRIAAGSTPLDLLYDVDPSTSDRFLGDEYRLRQILTNLLSNAIKFTQHGEVALTIHSVSSPVAHQSHIFFQVRDTGVGISSDEVPLIFTPFYQARGTTPFDGRGTGLGLAIVKKLVEQMGGKISAESVPGKGTTFSFSVLLQSLEGDRYQKEKVAEPPMSIVVIGDKTPALHFLVETLKRYQNEVHHLSPLFASSAWSTVLAGKDGVVISENESPEAKWLQELVGAAKVLQVPLVALAHSGNLSTQESFKKSGIDLILNTPVSADDLLCAFRGRSVISSPLSNIEPAIEKPEGQPLNVVIADDTPTNCFVLSSLLRELGHTVEVLTNGLDLLNRLRPVAAGRGGAPSVDLVLTDIQMPLMDGDAAVKRIRLIEGCAGSRHIPIIGVTARALPGEIESLRVAGLDDVLVKPVEEDEIFRLLNAYTGGTLREDTKPQGTEAAEEALATLVSDLTLELSPSVANDSTRPQLMDSRNIFRRSGRSIGNTRTFLRQFADSYTHMREELLKFTYLRDQGGVARSIHSLKGLLLDVGADTCVRSLKAFEEALERDPSGAQAWCISSVSGLLGELDYSAALANRVYEELPEQ
jgi:signal transduction histidine kinase/CheY-like chemotaxis protein